MKTPAYVFFLRHEVGQKDRFDFPHLRSCSFPADDDAYDVPSGSSTRIPGRTADGRSSRCGCRTCTRHLADYGLHMRWGESRGSPAIYRKTSCREAGTPLSIKIRVRVKEADSVTLRRHLAGVLFPCYNPPQNGGPSVPPT